MADYQRNPRARRPAPAARGTTTNNGQATLGPTYTPIAWACDRCGATVSDQNSHNRFHAGLVALWNGRRSQ